MTPSVAATSGGVSDKLEAGVESLLAAAEGILRGVGHPASVYSVAERHASLLALAMLVARGDDAHEARSRYLDLAVPLIATDGKSQNALQQSLSGPLGAAILASMFGDVSTRESVSSAATRDEAPQVTEAAAERREALAPQPPIQPEFPPRFARLKPGVLVERLVQWLRQLLERLGFRQQRARLVRKRISEFADRLNLSLPTVQVGLTPRSTRRAAVAAADRRTRPSQRLDLPRSIVRTADAGGVFIPVWKRKSIVSEYLVLARRVSSHDMEHARVRALAEDLRGQGVVLTFYSYDADPREVRDTLAQGTGSGFVSLEDLRERHPDARLVLATEGRELLNPLTLEPYSWTTELLEWPRRAIVSPMPSADWGVVERQLHRMGFSLSSSRSGGFENLGPMLGGSGPVAIFDTDQPAAPTPVFVAGTDLGQVLETAPDRKEQGALVTELKQHLGGVGYDWLAICAHFPTLSPPIVGYFGRKVLPSDMPRTVIDDVHSRLAGLPWMRHGYMPYWARRTIISSLTPAQRKVSRSIAMSVFDSTTLVAIPGARGEFDAAHAAGSAPMQLPIRFDGKGATGGLEVDDLAIEFFTGSDEELDPLLNAEMEELLRSTAAASQSAKSTQEHSSPIGAPPPAAPLKIVVSLSNRTAWMWRRIIDALDDLGHEVTTMPISGGGRRDPMRMEFIDEQIARADVVLLAYDQYAVQDFRTHLDRDRKLAGRKGVALTINVKELDAIDFSDWQGQPSSASWLSLLERIERIANDKGAVDMPPISPDERESGPSRAKPDAEGTEVTSRKNVYVIFRRRDAAFEANRIIDALRTEYADTVRVIGLSASQAREEGRELIAQAHLVLVLIGPSWLDERTSSGERRLDNTRDIVRQEIEYALTTPGVLVVPVLVNQATLPTAFDMPTSLRGLAERQAAVVRSGDPDFETDLHALVERLSARVAGKPDRVDPAADSIPDVFLSYSDADTRVMRTVSAFLRALDVSVVAVSDLPELGDTSAREAFADGLRRAKAVMVLISASWTQGGLEVIHSIVVDRPTSLILAGIDPWDLNTVPKVLRNNNIIDLTHFSGGELDDDTIDLAHELARVLGRPDLVRRAQSLNLAQQAGRADPVRLRGRFVCINHANRDRAKVRLIADALIGADLKIWLHDPASLGFSEAEIARSFVSIPGRGWNEQIDAAFETAACVLFCWSHGMVKHMRRAPSRIEQKFLASPKGDRILQKVVACRVDSARVDDLPPAFELAAVFDLTRPEEGRGSLQALVDYVRDIAAADRTGSDQQASDMMALASRSRELSQSFSHQAGDNAASEEEMGQAAMAKEAMSAVSGTLDELNRVPGRIWRDQAVGIPAAAIPEMVTLPRGSFLMGSPVELRQAGSDDREEPQHLVKLEYTFALARYPVTLAAWDFALAAGAKLRLASDQGWGKGLRPVIHVNWYDAQDYIAWLNERLGLTGRVDGYRLPTEAEWEYGCRAGTTTAFSFGDAIDASLANYQSQKPYKGDDTTPARDKTLPVGSFAPNAFGLHDMHGNVWEWCQDFWNPNYIGAPVDGSAWREGDSSKRVVRGGSWLDSAHGCRSAFRYGSVASERFNDVGFRLARTLLPR